MDNKKPSGCDTIRWFITFKIGIAEILIRAEIGTIPTSLSRILMSVPWIHSIEPMSRPGELVGDQHRDIPTQLPSHDDLLLVTADNVGSWKTS